MNCNEVKKIIELWESGYSPDITDIEGIRLHALSCEKCCGFAGLVPFMIRDSEAVVKPVVGDIEIPGDYSERIMSRIRKENIKRRKTVRFHPVLAFAASIIIIIGIAAGMLIRTTDTPEEIVVRFVLDAPDARSVSVAGDFTDWNAQSLKIVTKNNTNVWEIDLRLKKGNLYKYNFIIDGDKWVIDPNAPVRVDDGFGGQNSVISL